MRSRGSGGKRIVIVCAGGQGAVVADILQRAREAGSDAEPIGFVDDTPGLVGTAILGIDVLAPVASLGDIAHDAVIVALGDNQARRKMTERLARLRRAPDHGDSSASVALRRAQASAKDR